MGFKLQDCLLLSVTVEIAINESIGMGNHILTPEPNRRYQ